MNILMLTLNNIRQGTFLRAYNFARELVKMGHSTTLMVTAKKRRVGINEWTENGIHIVEMPDLYQGSLRSGWDPYNVSARVHWLKNKSFDLIHGFETRPTVIYPALALKKRGMPLVLDWCDWFGKGGSVEERPNRIIRTILRPIETFYEEHFRKYADGNTVINNTLFQRACMLGIIKEKLAIIPNGFNIPNWVSTSYESSRQLFGLSPKNFVIGYVGSLFLRDAKLMLEAFEQICNALPEVRLLHIGRSNYRLPSFDQLIITGDIDDKALQSALAACDVCWLPLSDIPANWGRSPYKFSNYLTAGKPIIMTNVGDLPEFVRDLDLGLTCAPTPDALAAATLQLIRDKDLLAKFSNSIRNLSSSSTYTWKDRTIQLLEFYQRII